MEQRKRKDLCEDATQAHASKKRSHLVSNEEKVSPRNINERLPVEIVAMILRQVDVAQIACRLTCRLWNDILAQQMASDWSPILSQCIKRRYRSLFVWMCDLAQPKSSLRDNGRWCATAARQGDLAMLRWLLAQGCRWDAKTCEKAARGGHLKVLKWALRRGCPSGTQDLCTAAAKGGHLVVLRWLYDMHERTGSVETCAVAARRGHLDVLVWLRSVDEGLVRRQRYDILRLAARGGHVHILVAFDAGGDPDDDWRLLISAAARHGQLAVLEWFRASSLSGDGLFRFAMPPAAGEGHLHILKWATEVLGLPLWPKLPVLAARGGWLETLRWLKTHQQGLRWRGSKVEEEAVKHSHVNVVEWLVSSGEQIHTTQVCALAAGCGDLQLLQRARAAQAPWDEHTLIAAVRGGHLGVLRWGRDHGCPWSKKTFRVALFVGTEEVIEWLKSNGCPQE